MSKSVRLCCVFLSLILVFTSLILCEKYDISVKADGITIGYVHATKVRIREQPNTSSTQLATVTHIYLTVNYSTAPGDGFIWYNITTDDGITGYIRGDLMTIVSAPSADAVFEEQISQFPESYKASLRALHSIYPNWTFVADKLSMSFETAVNNEAVGSKKLVANSDAVSWRSMGEGVYDWDTGTWKDFAGNWKAAARQVVEYYMDPRNFLNANTIYAFLDQSSYTETAEAKTLVEKVVKGTFLENGYYDPEDTDYGGSYINVIMEAARRVGIDPCLLAATISLEQGNGNSGLISGTTEHGKYFNFFNIGANGSNPVDNGLIYAKTMAWNTRSKAIIEGAAFYKNRYIDKGQVTYFYKNYNLSNEANLYGNQYAQSVYDTASSAVIIKKAYYDKYDAKLIFKIPVYTSIPEQIVTKPTANNYKNNYYLTSLSAIGLTDNFSMYRQSYSLSVSGNTAVYAKPLSGATIVSQSVNTLAAGNNRVDIKVRAETGYINTYTLNVYASIPCTLTVYASAGGDTNGDGVIDAVDLANIQKHIVRKIILSGDGFSAGDTNGDGVINAVDLANIQKYIVSAK